MSHGTEKKHITIVSKMWFVSETDRTEHMMDEDGNMFDSYYNYIVVYHKGKKIKLPYDSNYIFWDIYDKNMNVIKKTYTLIVEVSEYRSPEGRKKIRYRLLKVYDRKKLIYDSAGKNPVVR